MNPRYGGRWIEMQRDIANITRDLESNKNNDIIYKKSVILQMFKEDPDLEEVLGKREKRPLNQYADPNFPTQEELELRQEIEQYNKKVESERIIPFLKLNGIQKEVNNFVMFDVNDYDVSYGNKVIKTQQVIVMCLAHQDDMMTEYGIVRTDLLSYIVKDLLQWTNCMGTQLKCVSDYEDIIDDKYYARTLKFNTNTPNVIPTHLGMTNKYDRYS